LWLDGVKRRTHQLWRQVVSPQAKLHAQVFLNLQAKEREAVQSNEREAAQ